MDSGLATVVAASIAGFASIVGILLKFRKENREDHGSVMDVLERIDGRVERVGVRLDSHIHWHLGGDNGRAAQADQD